jgi:hypothetical protein
VHELVAPGPAEQVHVAPSEPVHAEPHAGGGA